MKFRKKIFGINLLFVFRHIWENVEGGRFLSEFREYSLGIWFKRNKLVGSSGSVNCYIIGVNLLICKMWISFDIGGLRLSFKNGDE